LTILWAYDDNQAYIADCVKRFCRPGQHGFSRNLNELLSTFATKTIARTAG